MLLGFMYLLAVASWEIQEQLAEEVQMYQEISSGT
jgi:hypothetical protein